MRGGSAASRRLERWPHHPEESIVLVKPCPTELTAPINPDRGLAGHTHLFCSYYDACRDEAGKQGWNSWTCTRCARHEIVAAAPTIASTKP